jgi:hypothetical protein
MTSKTANPCRLAAIICLSMTMLKPATALAQAADWQNVVWREPQVRYLMVDLSLGGNIDMYRKYATEEKDPDSREAIRLWDSGVRVVNVRDF